MQKKYKISTLLLASIMLVGCDNKKPNINHIHTFDDEWHYNDDTHYHICTYEGCNKRGNEETHNYVDGICSVCGFNDPNYNDFSFIGTADGHYKVDSKGNRISQREPHTLEEYEGDARHECISATCTSVGRGYKKCKICGKIVEYVIPKLDHDYGEWTVITPSTATSKGLKVRTCSVCNTREEADIPELGTDDSSFVFTGRLLEPQKIHTTNQENFLKYNKDYYNITSGELNSYNATGNAENSFPNQVSLSWNYTVPSGKTLKNYSIVTGQQADLSDGYTITGTTSKSISFYNPFLGVNYFKVIANFTDNTSESSNITTFLVDETAPRNLKIGSMSNCRDMGGRSNFSGGKIKQGLIYRTSETGSSPSNEIKEEMLNRFKIKSEIYVKDGSNSSSPLGSSVKFFNCSMDYGSTPYSNMCRNAERLRKVFSVLGDVNNYPLFYHCRIGTDRTGICGIAINGVLGVSFNETIQDYAFSNFGKIDGQRYAHKESDPNGDDCAKYIDEILAMPGKNFQEQTIYYLLTIGVPAQTIQNVIDIMTYGNKITVPTDIVVANGDNLSIVGGKKNTSSDYTNPDTYYEISGASQNVNFKYNLSDNKEVTVVAYLGGTDSSSSKKLADGIDFKIDGVSKTITNDKTYYLAGFGKTKQAGRTGYMFNILGKYSLASGQHTIALTGKNSDKFYIGGLSIIGAKGTVTAGEGDPEVVETTVASWKSTDSTDKNGVTEKTNSWGTYYKLNTNDSSYVEYKFNSTVSGKAYLKAYAGTKADNGKSSNKVWFDNGKAKFKFEINGNQVAFTDNTTTFADIGTGNTKASESDDSGSPVWIEFPEISIVNGVNTIKLTRTGGYSLYFYEFKVVTR